MNIPSPPNPANYFRLSISPAGRGVYPPPSAPLSIRAILRQMKLSPVAVVVLALGLVAAVNASPLRQAQGQCAAVTPINEFANVRSSPGISAGSPTNIVGQLRRGQVAAIESTPGSLWYKTALGYVHSSVVVCADPSTGSGPTATVTPIPPTPTRLPSLTPTPVISYSIIMRVCIIYGAGRESVCSLFSEPVAVTIERMP